jgi:hypothetical protein
MAESPSKLMFQCSGIAEETKMKRKSLLTLPSHFFIDRFLAFIVYSKLFVCTNSVANRKLFFLFTKSVFVCGYSTKFS